MTRPTSGTKSRGVGPERTAAFKAMHDAGTLGSYVDEMVRRMFAGEDREPIDRLLAGLVEDVA